MKIGIDIDGLLANYNDSFKKLLIETSGKDLFGPDHKYEEWYWDKAAGYTNEESQKALSIAYTSKTFWQDLSPYSENMNTLNCALWNGDLGSHDVYYITARTGVLVKDQTETWLEKHGVERPTVLICKRKGYVAFGLELDCFIDDNVPNVLDVAGHSPYTRSYLHNMDWNTSYEWQCTDPKRVNSLKEFFEKEKLI